jgi:hypothetical protein
MILFSMPDDQEKLPEWVDAQVVSSDLRRLATEISAVHDTPIEFTIPDRDEMEKWLGDRLPDVLDRGTVALDRDRLRKLLTDPRLLYGLQVLVIVDGGDYWTDLAVANARATRLASQGETTRQTVAGVTPGPSAVTEALRGVSAAADPREKPGTIQSVPRRLSNPMPRYVAALAASLAVVIGVWSLTRPTTPWGWNRAGALANATDPAGYLERLADAAGEWSATRPATEARLRTRLDELLAGCDRLIAAPHGALSEGDRVWLVERCKAWRGKIEGHRDALARSHDVEAVRREANDTVDKLIAALRKQATEIRARPLPPA